MHQDIDQSQIVNVSPNPKWKTLDIEQQKLKCLGYMVEELEFNPKYKLIS